MVLVVFGLVDDCVDCVCDGFWVVVGVGVVVCGDDFG